MDSWQASMMLVMLLVSMILHRGGTFVLPISSTKGAAAPPAGGSRSMEGGGSFSCPSSNKPHNVYGYGFFVKVGICLMAKKPQVIIEDAPEKMLEEIVVLRETDTPRAIECYTDFIANLGSERFIIAHPCDWAVSIGKPTPGGGLEAMPLEGPLADDLFSTLRGILEQDDIHLFRTPVTLTLQGEFMDEDDEDYDDEDDEEYDDEEEEEEEEEVEEEDPWYEVIGEGEPPPDDDDEEVVDPEPTDVNEQGVELIASFWANETEYCLVKHLDPTLIVARDKGQGQYELLQEKESASIMPLIEKAIMERQPPPPPPPQPAVPQEA